MKRVRQSIDNTIRVLQERFGAFDYDFYRRQVVAGLIVDGFKYVELENTGDWLTCVDPLTKKWINIDIYPLFSKLKSA